MTCGAEAASSARRSAGTMRSKLTSFSTCSTRKPAPATEPSRPAAAPLAGESSTRDLEQSRETSISIDGQHVVVGTATLFRSTPVCLQRRDTMTRDSTADSPPLT